MLGCPRKYQCIFQFRNFSTSAIIYVSLNSPLSNHQKSTNDRKFENMEHFLKNQIKLSLIATDGVSKHEPFQKELGQPNIT